MESTIVMIGVFGAVALLLFGLAQVKDGMSRAFGTQLRVALARGTGNGVRSFVSGLAATLALQSSTATTLMTASFVEQDLIRPRMAQTVLLGANVGTAITAWVVATGIEWLSPLLILTGFVFYRRGSASRQGGGTAMVGVGLMLLSLHLLSVSTEPLRQSSALAAFIALLDNAWPVAFALSAALAFISSSSLAAIVLILSLAATGILSPGLVVAFVLGANVGGAIPPVIATLGGAAAVRRLTLGNLIIRAVCGAIALPLTGFAVQLLDLIPLSPVKLPVDIHLAFNVGVAALAWPFSRLLSRLMLHIVPEDTSAEDAPRYIDDDELSTPILALANATREVLGVGDLIERMLLSTSEAFEKNDLAKAKTISSLEIKVDRLQQDVKVYLSKLGREDLIEDHRRRSIVILDYAINLEHIGDIIEKGLVPQVAKKVSLGLKFSEDGFEELRKLLELTIDNLRIAQTIFVTRDFDLARQMMEIKVDVRRMEKQSSQRHLERLRDGRADSLQTSSLHLDILRDLKRINAHIVSVAHPILHESGVLIESRLRNVG